MSNIVALWILGIVAICAVLTSCASPDPVAYKEIACAPHLRPDPDSDSRRVAFSYSTQVDWQRYSKAIVDPVAVYRGADNQFEDMPEADKATLASYMQTQFMEKLAKRLEITDTPAPDTLRIKLTLTGAATTTPVLGTLSHFDIGGGLYNGVQAIRGGEGTMTGSVLYAVEIYDAETSDLLNAFVAKQYPNAMNIGASFGSLGAAKTGIEKGADALVEQLDTLGVR